MDGRLAHGQEVEEKQEGGESTAYWTSLSDQIAEQTVAAVEASSCAGTLFINTEI